MAKYDPRQAPIEVTDQTGRTWKGVPGFGNEISSRPPRGRVEIELVKGEKPPCHKQYAARKRAYEFYEASYKGGSDYKNAKDADGQGVFIPHETESPEAAKRRKRLSTYRNYCKPIVDKFRAFLFSSTITRDATAAWQKWGEDVDGHGTCLGEFVEQAVQKAMILGRWLVIADTTKESDYETEAQAKANGNRMILSSLHPARVINWNEDESELLIRHDGVGENGEVWLWSAKSIRKCPLNDKGEIQEVGGEEAHGWSQMPIVCFDGLNPGESLIADISEMNKAIYNDDSLLREELHKQIFTQFFLMGISADKLTDESAVAIGSRKFICISESAETVRMDRASGDPSMAESIRQTLEQDEKEIYRMVGLRPPDVVETGSQAPESGRALKIRQAETVALVERVSDNSERAERGIVEFYNEATNKKIEPPHYAEDFNQEDLANVLQETLACLAAPGIGPLFKAEAIKQLIDQKFEDIDAADREALEEEADNMAMQPQAIEPPADDNLKGQGAAAGLPMTGDPGKQPEALPGDKALAIDASKGAIPTKSIVAMHGLDQGFVDELAASMKKDGYQKGDDKRVLGVKYDNGLHLILDGHHRAHAAKQAGMKSVPAWVVDHRDLRPLLDARHDGSFPDKMSELDQHIKVDGKPYPYRQPNDHAKGTGAKDTQAKDTQAQPKDAKKV